MRSPRSLAFVFCFTLACMVFLPTAQADEWNQMTKIKFSEPIEIPGAVLPAGTYWFVLANNHGDRPQWSPQNQPTVVRAKPANGKRPGT